ncbi:hypothetical protein EYF80_058554 [Liparis tanakae]|uniref:Uncharacterized protein n=1 Tax=Liparis tanakae TaxID=230148 RepID=A0A4Z2ESG0_9TELE|nr:hypothetical protein EYF80_058554 [Liparis tanakae]
MPIAATGQPTTREPRVCPRLPSTPEPVPKGADLFDEAGAAESAERTEYGGAEGGRGPGRGPGYSYSQSGARGFAQPGSTIGSPPQSPVASSSFLFHPLHPHQMAMEPPRTRSRSRSGYYQQYGGGNANGITGSGVMGSNHHHHHLHHQHQHHQHHHQHHQQQLLHPQQHGAGCAPLGAHGNLPENQPRAPGSNASPGIHRLPSVPGAHRIPAEGKCPPLVIVNV